MDFIDQLRMLAAQVEKQVDFIQTEEATKQCLVMPFISALGYNLFDPTEVVPEFTADVGTKKGEKVDYAIFKDGKPIVLFECKCHNCDLDAEHASQLFRYFTVTPAKFSVLTNGITYRFYTDIDEANKMDPKPFYEFNLFDIKDQNLEVLKRFTKAAFNTEDNFGAAVELKYTREIKRHITEELNSPTEEFVRIFASRVSNKKMTQAVLCKFTDITKRAFNQFLNDRINDRLKSAMESEGPQPSEANAKDGQAAIQEASAEYEEKRVVTSPEVLESYYIIKGIVGNQVDPKRISLRETANCCGVLLDDSNRKPICRLRFNGGNTDLGLIKEGKREERVSIEDIDDILAYSDQIKATINLYEQGVTPVS